MVRVIMVNKNDNKKEKKIQVMYNTIARHSLTDARPPLPDPRSNVLPGNYPQFIDWA